MAQRSGHTLRLTKQAACRVISPLRRTLPHGDGYSFVRRAIFPHAGQACERYSGRGLIPNRRLGGGGANRTLAAPASCPPRDTTSRGRCAHSTRQGETMKPKRLHILLFSIVLFALFCMPAHAQTTLFTIRDGSATDPSQPT